jgi:hypothetical protein
MAKKHIFLFVPNYDGTGATDRSPLSYLFLGAGAPSVAGTTLNGTGATWPGGDLLEAAGVSSATGFYKDDSAARNDGIDRNHAGAGTTYYRYKANGQKEAVAGPTALTAELATRGGYRDHTDGNRISTTRGDRVDFIQGNYKRVVFGRVTNTNPDLISLSTWESSGGHNHTTTSFPGEVKTITWETGTYGDTWKVIDRTEKGDTISRYSGVQHSYYRGPFKRSVTGKWTHSDDPAYPASTSFDGDDYPDIVKESYVKAVSSTTTLRNQRDRTTAGTEIKGETLPKYLTSDVGTTSNRVHRFKDHLAASSLTQQQFYVVKFEHVRGGEAEANYGNALSLSVGALALRINLGVNLDLLVGNFTADFSLAAVLSAFFGLKVNTMIGADVAVDLKKGEIKVNDVAVDLTKLEGWGTAAKLLVAEKSTSASDIHL